MGLIDSGILGVIVNHTQAMFIIDTSTRYSSIADMIRRIIENLRTKRYHIELSDNELTEEEKDFLLKAIDIELTGRLKCQNKNEKEYQEE